MSDHQCRSAECKQAGDQGPKCNCNLLGHDKSNGSATVPLTVFLVLAVAGEVRPPDRGSFLPSGRAGNSFASSRHLRNGPTPFSLLCDANLPQLHFFRGEALSVRDSARFNPKKGRHASASNFPEHCNSGGLQHHPSEYRVFARVSGNVGTTKGLHARRLAAMRRANPRCGQDRGLLTTKYSATQRSVPRGF